MSQGIVSQRSYVMRRLRFLVSPTIWLTTLVKLYPVTAGIITRISSPNANLGEMGLGGFAKEWDPNNRVAV